MDNYLRSFEFKFKKLQGKIVSCKKYTNCEMWDYCLTFAFKNKEIKLEYDLKNVDNNKFFCIEYGSAALPIIVRMKDNLVIDLVIHTEHYTRGYEQITAKEAKILLLYEELWDNEELEKEEQKIYTKYKKLNRYYNEGITY